MALSSMFIIVFLLLGIISYSKYEVYAYGNKELLSLKKLQWAPQGYGKSFLPQKSKTNKGTTILEMQHRDYSGPVRNRQEKLEKHLIADDNRVKSIQSRIKTKLPTQTQEPSSQPQIPVTSGIKLQTLNYVVPITLASRNLTVIIDTGSDLTWVQCQPCRLCYTQPEPLFNPSLSPSYQTVQCNSQLCHTLHYATGNFAPCGTNPCAYTVTYGDGSYTRGEVGKDQLLLGATTVDDFAFGCGRNNKGLFGAASGLMGLGRSDLSLISQTFDQFGGVFSYCLPDTESDTSGSLILGSDTSVYKNSTPFSFTGLLQNPQMYSFYVLNLTGATVGGSPLDSTSFNKLGILIDSGTVITRLPPSIYSSFKNEFLKQFSGYPSAPGFSILDTCFNLTAYEEVDVPTLGLQFEGGAELSVDVKGMFYFVKRDASQVCLALASLAYEDEIGIIGNFQQRNTRVVYDIKEMKLGFAKEVCSF